MSELYVIRSRQGADKLLRGEHDIGAVVSISDLGRRPPFNVTRFVGPKCVFNTFEDVDAGPNAPGVADIRRLIRFLEGYQGRRFLFHCEAGIGRSSAAAVIAAHLHGAHPLSVLNPNVHWPNLRMLEIADQLLGLNSTLHRLVLAWRSGVGVLQEA